MRIEKIPGAGPRSQAAETPHSFRGSPWSCFDQVSRTSGSKTCRDGKASGTPVDRMWPGKTAWHKNVMWYKVSNKSYRLLWTVVREVKINTRGTREPLSIF